MSTNSLLWKLVEEGAKPGTAVVADYQRGGKGQAGARWESEAGANILLSMYLPVPFLEASVQFRLNIAVALAVSDFAKLYLGEGIRLKWPNDLYYHQAKLGGILIENSIQGSFLADSVVGVGININQAHFFWAIQCCLVYQHHRALLCVKRPARTTFYLLSETLRSTLRRSLAATTHRIPPTAARIGRVAYL